MLQTKWPALTNAGDDHMPFLVLDRDGHPMVDPDTGLICQFDTREDAETYRKAHKGNRVMEIPTVR